MKESGNYKSCRSCGAEIAMNSDTCKYCGAWQKSVIWKVVVLCMVFSLSIYILQHLPV